ncbi:MAG TPA: hypothetical protein PLE99_14355 [Candidatus Thiothrix moscowensis]|uniref:hypothetical protein n=1 Tax=unclassified Thiothrix TaxID=2636184 RepID=UPI001A1F95B3|nr:MULTISPECIES: hypothetical protein [unclassified Thiothrix]MBJ6608930.1 hypothetical protein [Candidatus Thiothrix moscowensis]HRJ53936.1 hypothetical protein [Candidatus Thiothrix moscowensis]HRJ94018.1 hypothetical protein [Candidatus Thiothrix moscowensis]
MKRSMWLTLQALLLTVLLSGCIFSSESQQARDVADKFWQAVLSEDMETAKDLVTWESAQYLQYLDSKSIAAQRFETGEIKIQDNTAEVATVLYGGEKGDMVIPVRTILVRGKDKWQVDVQKTMGSMVSGAMGAVVDQLNTFMQEGLRDLDKALSDSVNELNKSLKQGVEQLQKDLTVPPPPQPASPTEPSSKQAI